MVTFLKDGTDRSLKLYLILRFGATVLVKIYIFFPKEICFPYLENPVEFTLEGIPLLLISYLLSVLLFVAESEGWLILSLFLDQC